MIYEWKRILGLFGVFSANSNNVVIISSQFGRTEVIDNTLNPDFVRKFVLDFFFEEKQHLRFDV